MKDLSSLIQKFILDPFDKQLKSSISSCIKRFNLPIHKLIPIINPIKEQRELLNDRLIAIKQEQGEIEYTIEKLNKFYYSLTKHSLPIKDFNVIFPSILGEFDFNSYTLKIILNEYNKYVTLRLDHVFYDSKEIIKDSVLYRIYNLKIPISNIQFSNGYDIVYVLVDNTLCCLTFDVFIDLLSKSDIYKDGVSC